MNMVDIR